MALMVSCAVCRDRSLCARGCRRRSSAFEVVTISAMFWTRRRFLGGVLVVTGAYARGGSSVRKLDLIDAPSNLGLRPPKPGVEPGTWRAPAALEAAGLSKSVRPDKHFQPRPAALLDRCATWDAHPQRPWAAGIQPGTGG